MLDRVAGPWRSTLMRCGVECPCAVQRVPCVRSWSGSMIAVLNSQSLAVTGIRHWLGEGIVAVFVGIGAAAGDGVGSRQPAGEVNIGAALRAERLESDHRRLAADRAARLVRLA